MEKVSINGPYNYFKLTNGEKTICLFSDVHYETNNQSECKNAKNSVDIDHFLKEFLINSNSSDTKYDLFIEHLYNRIINKSMTHNYRDRYIERVAKLFEKNMNYDLKKNKIIKSKSYPNINFHYFDFRDTIPESNLNSIKKMIYPPYDSQPKISSIIYIIDTIKKEYTSFKNNIKDNKYRYINKILNNYSDKKLKEKMNMIFDNHIIKFIDYILNLCQEINDEINEKYDLLLNKYTNNKIKFELSIKIYKNLTFINNNMILVFSACIDLYFIRRLLEKNYINNVIGYMGGYHVTNIVFILVKYFNFEIIDCFYNMYNYNIKKINDVFSKASNSYEVYPFFDNTISQCIEINGNIF